MEDYVATTLRAYEGEWQKYESATAGMIPDLEIDRFVAGLPDSQGAVLDAGCAYGRDTSLLAQRGLEAVGVDATSAFIRRAEALHPDLRFARMDLRSLDFPDDTFDGVWCQATLHHFRDDAAAQVLAEFHRVTRPGGRLFVSVKEGTSEEQIVEAFSTDSARFFRYHTVERLTDLLKNAGFNRADVIRSNEQQRYGPGHRDLVWLHAFATA